MELPPNKKDLLKMTNEFFQQLIHPAMICEWSETTPSSLPPSRRLIVEVANSRMLERITPAPSGQVHLHKIIGYILSNEEEAQEYLEGIDELIDGPPGPGWKKDHFEIVDANHGTNRTLKSHQPVGVESGESFVDVFTITRKDSKGNIIGIQALMPIVSDRRELHLANQENLLKTAIITILVDSFAHNISAHSLAALQWWIRQRNEFLERKIYLHSEEITGLETLQPSDIDFDLLRKIASEQSQRYYEILGLHDSTNTEEYISLADFLRFAPNDPSDDIQTKLLEYNVKVWEKATEYDRHGKDKGASRTYRPRLPVPIDYALWPFFRFLRDKAAFWSGVTRDIAFGGESATWYQVLWHDFANNPLFLGTIANSEQIYRLNIKIELDLFDPKHTRKKIAFGPEDGEFVEIDLSVIDYERRLFEDRDRLPADGSESKYAFVKLGKGFSKIRALLSGPERQVFFPGGVVGKQAFFTIIENTIRNVKHYRHLFDGLNGIRQSGLDLVISIRETGFHFAKSINSKNASLYEVGIRLDHPIAFPKRDNPLNTKLLFDQVESVVNREGRAKLGGNSQDKICAAMLMTNRFSQVEQVNNYRDFVYYPWVDHALISKGASYRYSESLSQKRFQDEGHLNTIEKSRKAKRHGIRNWQASTPWPFDSETGPVKSVKYIHLWKAENTLLWQPEDSGDFQFENTGRFRFVMTAGLPNNETIANIRMAGLIRTVVREEISAPKDQDAIYRRWLETFLYSRDFALVQNEALGVVGLHTYREFEEIEYEDDSEPELLPQLAIAHGNNQRPQEVIDYRNHGVFREYFFSETLQMGLQKQQKVFEFHEVLLTRISLWDNRLFGRVPAQKRELYRNTLFLQFNDEQPEAKSFDFTSLPGSVNFLVLHLSFIESLGDYGESQISDFIENRLGISPDAPHNPRFLLVITTGRGRMEWYQQLKPGHKRFTIFRPIESLLSAVEDAVNYKDDFQVKYNLIKVLFGS